MLEITGRAASAPRGVVAGLTRYRCHMSTPSIPDLPRKRFSSWWLIAVVAVCGLAFAASYWCAPPAADAAWSRPVTLTANSHLAVYPVVALDRASRVLVAWSEDSSAASDYEVRTAFRAKGQSWTVRTIPDGGASGTFPQIASGYGRISGTIWVRGLISHAAASVSPSIDAVPGNGSARWSRPMPVSTGAATPSQVRIATDAAGNSVAVWMASFGQESFIETSQSLRGTHRWARPTTLASGRSLLLLPQIGISPRGAAVATWLRIVGGGPADPSGQRNEVFAARRSAAGRWGSAHDLGTEYEPPGESAAAFEFPGPRVALDSQGRAIVVWQQKQASRLTVVSAVSTNATWTTPRKISSPAVDAVRPELAVDPQGDAVVAWVGPGQRVDVTQTRIDEPCGWTTPTTVWRGDPRVDPYPRLAINSRGTTLVSWSGASVGVAVRDSSRSPWQRTRLTSGGNTAVAINARGTAAVVWQHPTRAGITVQFAQATLPLASPTLRPRCAAGRR